VIVKVTLKKKDVLGFWNGLQSLSRSEQNRKLYYAIGRNLQKVRPIVEVINEAIKPLDDFEKGKIELVKKYSVKDDNGNPVEIPGNQGVRIQDINRFNNALSELGKETGQDKRDKEVSELLESEESIDLYMVDLDMLPEKMVGILFEPILPMVREPDSTEG
jgi:hypothetical protein